MQAADSAGSCAASSGAPRTAADEARAPAGMQREAAMTVCLAASAELDREFSGSLVIVRAAGLEDVFTGIGRQRDANHRCRQRRAVHLHA